MDMELGKLHFDCWVGESIIDELDLLRSATEKFLFGAKNRGNYL